MNLPHAASRDGCRFHWKAEAAPRSSPPAHAFPRTALFLRWLPANHEDVGSGRLETSLSPCLFDERCAHENFAQRIGNVAREVVIRRTIAASPLLQFFAKRPGYLAGPDCGRRPPIQERMFLMQVSSARSRHKLKMTFAETRKREACPPRSFVMRNSDHAGRWTPRHPRLAAAGFRLALPIAERFFRHKNIHRPDSQFAAQRSRELAERLARGETCYLAGVNIGGFHNTGAALVDVTPANGLRIICNNEEERFSGRKHTSAYPRASLEALAELMRDLNIAPDQIAAWMATYDFPLYMATGVRLLLQEFPASLDLAFQDHAPTYDGDQFRQGLEAPERLGRLFGVGGAIPIIGMPHHDNHAYFSYLVSPFARDRQKVMIVVVDGSCDFASTSLYLGENGAVRQVRTNASIFDSLGIFHGIISSTQGGWTALSSEGRYMGAAAYGDMDRTTNRYYRQLRGIFQLRPDGHTDSIGPSRAGPRMCFANRIPRS